MSSVEIDAVAYSPSPGQSKIASTRNVLTSEYPNTRASVAATGFQASFIANRPYTARSPKPSARTICTWVSPMVSSTWALIIRVSSPAG